MMDPSSALFQCHDLRHLSLSRLWVYAYLVLSTTPHPLLGDRSHRRIGYTCIGAISSSTFSCPLKVKRLLILSLPPTISTLWVGLGLGLFLPLNLPTLSKPIIPTPRIFTHLPSKPGPSRQLRRCPTPHAGLTIENHFIFVTWLRPPKPLLKLVRRQEKGVRRRLDRQIVTSRDFPRVL